MVVFRGELDALQMLFGIIDYPSVMGIVGIHVVAVIAYSIVEGPPVFLSTPTIGAVAFRSSYCREGFVLFKKRDEIMDVGHRITGFFREREYMPQACLRTAIATATVTGGAGAMGIQAVPAIAFGAFTMGTGAGIHNGLTF